MQVSRYQRWLVVPVVGVAFTVILTLPDAGGAGKEAQKKTAKKAKAGADLQYPPTLPGGKEIVTDTSDDFLKPTMQLKDGVTIAKAAPTVDFMYYPGQTYPGHPWSAWGDSLAVNGKYYASIGDHWAVDSNPATTKSTGTARVFEYDPETRRLRQLVDVAKLLALPAGHYTPGKIHGRLDMGSDGWLYFSTHRGSTRVTTDKYHYKGDWIFRCDPRTGKAEVVAQGPVPKHCIPNSVLDPDRMIFYGGTAPSDSEDRDIRFFAYDVKNRKLLYAGPDGPSRYMIFVKSTGRIYYTPGRTGISDGAPLMRYHPDENGGKPVVVSGKALGIRAATQETPQGFVYAVSQGAGATLWSFNTKTEAIENLGPPNVGNINYIASLDADPSGRYLYYTAGAHGGGEKEGTPIVQFDVKTRQKKVIAFLHPFYKDKYGCTLTGTFSSAVDPKGDKLYITWNARRGSGKAWDCCALTVIHIPESERRP